MSTPVTWQYDEFRQVGKDYASAREVAVYDETHADFRDMVKESERVLQMLALAAEDTLIDFGAGTGAFAVQAARRCAKVYAVDVSPAMLAYAKEKAAKAGVSNIEFRHAGFLTYEHPDRAVDAIVSTFALHHLPDFWKGVALHRMHGMLKPGGRLYLCDVVMGEDKPLEDIAAFIEQQALAGGEFLRDDAEGHFREEYSTYDWVMEGLLNHTGFQIESKTVKDGVIRTYLCRRVSSAR